MLDPWTALVTCVLDQWVENARCCCASHDLLMVVVGWVVPQGTVDLVLKRIAHLEMFYQLWVVVN